MAVSIIAYKAPPPNGKCVSHSGEPSEARRSVVRSTTQVECYYILIRQIYQVVRRAR